MVYPATLSPSEIVHDAPLLARSRRRPARSRASHARRAAAAGVIAVDYSDVGDWCAFVHEYRWSFPDFGDRDGTLGDA